MRHAREKAELRPLAEAAFLANFAETALGSPEMTQLLKESAQSMEEKPAGAGARGRAPRPRPPQTQEQNYARQSRKDANPHPGRHQITPPSMNRENHPGNKFSNRVLATLAQIRA